MFNKKNSLLETYISKDVTIKGELTTEGLVRIDGNFEGNILVDGLIIGKTGDVKGEVTAREIMIDGNIEGNINAKEIIEIKPDGKVQGDIQTVKLIIAEGAFFVGRSTMQKPQETLPEQDEQGKQDEQGENKVKKLFKSISIFF
ncbi:MAG: Polymer-forming cytoskeletal [Syntrophorhabdus sp. PtaU1.Bin058]|nr:MAG: Polymer-forming cytoskeletal [Syntrophorhabdus sp. PtaU1.Bin058]